jgi:hypothetical protein
LLGATLFRGGAKALAKKRGAREKYRKASDLLAELTQPVVVVIDDIDRLTSEEIRDVFKLVRLTASFPNVIYLLAFDRTRVEEALAEPGIPGRAYLEKIIQVPFDLPATPAGVLRSQVFSALDVSLSELDGETRFSIERWPDIYFEVIEPLISNMRDVVRFAASIRPTLSALATEIESVDLLAMEAIRIFRPELFAQLREMPLTLTETTSGYGVKDGQERKEEVEALVTSAGDDAEMVRSLIRRLFPASQRHIGNSSYGADWKPTWRKEHRLAHADFLTMYFDRVAPASLMAFRLAEELRVAMESPAGFDAKLAAIPSDELPDVLSSLESFKGDFPEEHIATSAAALLNQTYRVPPTPVFGFTLRPAVTVIRPVLRMLEQLADDAARENIAKDIFNATQSFSSKCDFVESIGRRENSPNLISTALADELDAEIVSTFITPPPHVNDEWDLARVYHFMAERKGESAQLAGEVDAGVTRAVLRSAMSHSTRQSLGSRHVATQATYPWDWLVELYGTESALRDAVEALREVDGETELVMLADRYFSGWRHKSITDPDD